MTIKLMTQNELSDFLSYCETYRYAHDESFLDEEEMAEFTVNEKDPTYLLYNEDKLIGVLSIMYDDYYVAGQKARIRIFHCIEDIREHYQLLLSAALPVEFDIDRLEMFLPDKVSGVQDIVKDLGFSYYRTSYVMVRKGKDRVTANFPVGYELKPLVVDRDEEAYAFIRNKAFENLKGSQTPINKEIVHKLFNDKWLLKEGMQLLWYKDSPVGVLRMIHESDDTGEYSFVAPIALLPEHQGKGIGRELLKAGIELGQQNDLNDCMLVVNAENEQALSMYQKSGFETLESVSCFVFNLLDEDQVLDHAIFLMDADRIKDAQEYIEENQTKTKGLIRGQIDNFRYCLAALAGKKELALDILRSTIEEKGNWYRPVVFEDDDLTSLQGDSEFERLKHLNELKYKDALVNSKPVATWSEKKADNILLAMHGNQQNISHAKKQWDALASDSLQVEYLQSSDIDSFLLYRWENEGSAPDQIHSAINAMDWDAYSKRTLGGFSAGCNAIARAVAEKQVHADRLVLVGPWLPSFYTKGFEPLFEPLKLSKVLIVCGDLDNDCLPHAKALHSALTEANIDCRLEIVENMGHAFHKGFASLVEEWI
ncbi:MULTISPECIES: GNAT family N-acetyltransferase [unclassified Fusibacter]|uniref:GNAT family N-acetyltransferase n=1 Tax=unclassified Fusibacter TaxID=2624464 RepID=UPI001011FA67|nr:MULTISPECIES: GNAT family N-acetyltransferase [unclassified Fusibacter]MCK8059169.1 GNAT family N-acetyltransferase [Fusibacter sp. A2]NPE22578.1 GNAT family N-acetyltransferase [Fusibacter sp. A1]RXV60679.1 GNAT family N-acetyltransferase [Fusibacter sp. A1]